MTTGEEAHCAVVDVDEGPHGVPEVGVEFPGANTRVWRISFRPADWSARSAEAKRYRSSRNPAASPAKASATKK